MALLIVQLKRWQDTGGREGERHAAKDPRPGLEPGAARSEDKASVHGTPAPPTGLNGASLNCF